MPGRGSRRLAKGCRRMAALALVCRAAFFTLSATCAWTSAALAATRRLIEADVS